MLKKIAHFSTGNVYTGFSENEDGSITKSALVFVEGEHQDNRGRSWATNSSFIEKLVENTNRAFEEGKHIPILKDHVKTVDAEIGVLDAPLEARIITEEDLPNKRDRDLIGKLGVFCDGIVLKAKDVVERVKSGLNRTISPGIDMSNVLLKEISLTPTPAIKSLSLFSEGSGVMDGIYTLDDADAMSQDEEDLKEEFEDLSCKFYCVVKNIMKSADELGEEADVMIEKAFADYEIRLRDLFGLTDEIPDEDESVADTQRNGYSLQQAPSMVTPDYAPYSLYEVDTAEFAMLDPLKKLATGYGQGLRRMKFAANDALKGDWKKAGDRFKNYFTKANTAYISGGGFKGSPFVTDRSVRWGRVGKAAGAVAGTGVAGYGAYRLGRAGLGAVGIGRKERENPAPWYRRNPFN